MKKTVYAALFILFVACNNTDSTQTSTSIAAPDSPKPVGYSVLNTYLHDTSSFTQGLTVYNGKVYEGTGEYGHSGLLQVI